MAAMPEANATRCRGKAIDLNNPPPPDSEQGSGSSYVLLQRDSKNICQTKVDVPSRINVPSVWPISKFVPIKEYQQNDFLQFSLIPDPEDHKQEKEWGKFMRFLRENKKVGVVKFGPVTFHILHGPHSFSALVLYETTLKNPGVCKKMARICGRSNTSEETCEMNTSRKLHGLVPESSACVSVEDGPRFFDPAVNKKSSSLARNLAKTSPSYLRTLGQTHAGWIFGAIAELVDNSRDAGSSRLDISIQSMFSKKADRRVPVLCVVDNGHGMTYDQMMKMVLFGHDGPNEHSQDQIGRFGIGFKTGAMKLGKDALVLTQTSNSRSVSFLSQSYNENKKNLEIPVVAYYKKGQYMEYDLSVQSKATAEHNLNAVKDYSPFNEYIIGEKVALFGEEGTGTQVYIWNLDRWGADYTLEWYSEKTSENPASHENGNILIRSKRVRSRPGQTSSNVPLDYSLKDYLQVMFLNRQMEIIVQGSPVIICPLENTLDKKSVISGEIMGRIFHLTLGRSDVEYGRVNSGIFLYWHGRLIESYKRVGGQKHNAVTGRGIIGVADITDLIDDEDGNTWVLNSKQGFQDCEMYAKLEEWLGKVTDEYWKRNFENLELRKGGELIKAVDDVVQCGSCRKCRKLNPGFNIASLPLEWFCYLPPFNGSCDVPEEEELDEVAMITVAAGKISGHKRVESVRQDEDVKNVKLITPVPTDTKGNSSPDATNCQEEAGDDFVQAGCCTPQPPLKRPSRGCRSIYKKRRCECGCTGQEE